MSADKALYPVLLANGDPVGGGRAAGRPALGGMARSLPQALLSVRAGRRRSRRQSRQLHHRLGPRGRARHLGARRRSADAPSMPWRRSRRRWRGTRRSTAANMISPCSTSSRSPISTSARWRTRASTSSTRATSWPIPETATDADYDAIAGVVAHEYFHNWSGNRVTCRDWFQLSLKEGFTVFRDQSFSADMGSPAVKRIEDVRAAPRRAIPRGCRPARPSGAARFLYRDLQLLHRDRLQQGRRADPDDAHHPRPGEVPRRHRPLFRAP